MGSSSPSIVSRFSQNSKEMSKKYEEIISTLPKVEPADPYLTRQYKGFWLPSSSIEAALSLSENYKALPSDIYLCSFPKTGTTWLKSLTFSIMTRDKFDDSTNPLLNKVPHDCVRSLEVEYLFNFASLDNEMPLLASHLPYTCLPPSILESDCKIIYVCREPKDTFVSWWHFGQKQLQTFGVADGAPTLEQEFQWFHDGQSMYGPYWDHVVEFWKASLERPDKVFFIKYEDLKSGTLCYVKKLAEFMGKPFSKEEEDQGVPEKIMARCSIKSLKNLEVNNSGWFDLNPHKIHNSSFFRKGETGDWKNLLTEDMAKAIDNITREKFQSVGLTYPISAPCENNKD